MHRPPSRPDDEFVPERLRERLLERASEIDARDARVADLRDAASEAGISQRAFDAALEEMRLTRELRTEKRKRTRGMRLLVTFLVSAAVTITVGSYIVPRTIAQPTYAPPSPTPGTATYYSEDYGLGCLTGQEAIELVRPVLKDRVNTISYSTVDGQLRIGATAAQHLEVKSLLLGTCAARAGDAPPTP